MGKNFGRKAVMAGCIGMAAVALLVTVLTLSGNFGVERGRLQARPRLRGGE